MTLTYAEIRALETIADRSRPERVSRSHLERLSRLDLIEPCDGGVCMTSLGKKMLSGRG